METNEIYTTERTTPEGTDGFAKAYIRLRTVLDALEVNALRYCLDNTNTAERIKRAADIERMLMYVIEQVQGIPKKSSDVNRLGICDDGYYNCGGVCVPYQCTDNLE
jgi:hypothetical protein